jgi:hypothetical protein
MIRMDVRKDRLLPTFSRTSAAGFRGAPPTYPKLNLGFRFDAGSVVDEPARLEVAIWRERGSGPASAEVTLTRVQRFKPAAGQVCTWQIGDKSGEVAVGTDGLITIPNCPMTDRPARLVVVPK